ncbi:MAG TPA: transglycosylase SLT domain-containing protein [Rubrivivax sp.]|nr:transglycosylase SLT domain-containing protein [Rubrivivax sp.]
MTLSFLPAIALPLLRHLASSAALVAVALSTGCAGLPPQEGRPAETAATAATAPSAGETEFRALVVSAPLQAVEPEFVLAPLQPRMRLDPEQDAERADLWQRLRDGYAMPALDGELVQKWEQWYASRPDYVQRMTERGSRYLFHIVEEVELRGLPSELALLPFIESAFNPQAVSHARASGMWQFMPATGKDFELQQNLFRDDRRDVLASTRAALDYLQQLHAQFGDWHLALAAYNWGQGNVQRAIDRNRRAGKPTDYASLKMPAETRNYVPKLQAVMNIVASPEAYGLALPLLENHPQFLTVQIESDIDVALATQLAGLPLEEFQHLNPQHNKPVILAAGSPQLLLPYDNANRFLRELALHTGPTASWTAWVAPKTLKPADAAKRVGMSESLLREVNRIPPRMLVRAGSTLLVPRASHSDTDVAEHIAHTAALKLAPEARPQRRVVIKARKGDSVATVARRMGVSVSNVAQWNKVGVRATFKPGQHVVVMMPAKTKKAASSKTAPKRKAKPAPSKRAGPAAKK